MKTRASFVSKKFKIPFIVKDHAELLAFFAEVVLSMHTDFWRNVQIDAQKVLGNLHDDQKNTFY